MAKSIFDLPLTMVSGKSLDLSAREWGAILVVNIASRCGFTPQLGSLEDLYQKYKERGLLLMAFPSNDFLEQEPLSNEEINEFCVRRYGISFPVVAKAPVTGDAKQEMYKFLTERSHKKYQGDPGWNFVKFLLDSQGEVVGRYSSITRPGSKKICYKIEGLLELFEEKSHRHKLKQNALESS